MLAFKHYAVVRLDLKELDRRKMVAREFGDFIFVHGADARTVGTKEILARRVQLFDQVSTKAGTPASGKRVFAAFCATLEEN